MKEGPGWTAELADDVLDFDGDHPRGGQAGQGSHCQGAKVPLDAAKSGFQLMARSDGILGLGGEQEGALPNRVFGEEAWPEMRGDQAPLLGGRVSGKLDHGAAITQRPAHPLQAVAGEDEENRERSIGSWSQTSSTAVFWLGSVRVSSTAWVSCP